MSSKEKKLRDLDLGKFAEKTAADYYIKQGYVVKERNWRHGKSEIDLILQKDDTIVFVEVKARSGDDEDPINSVTLDKMKRMVRVSEAYLREMDGIYYYRYDIFGFTGNMDRYETEVYQDAFLATDIF